MDGILSDKSNGEIRFTQNGPKTIGGISEYKPIVIKKFKKIKTDKISLKCPQNSRFHF